MRTYSSVFAFEDKTARKRFIDDEEDIFQKKDAKYDFNRFKKVKGVTSQMGKYFDRDIYLVLHGRATVFYFMFVVCATITAVGVIDSKMYFLSQSLRNHLKEQAGYSNPSLNVTSEGKYHEIGSASEMWEFVEGHLIRYIHAYRSPHPIHDYFADNTTANATRRRRQASFEGPQQRAIGLVSFVEDRGLGYENFLIGRPVIRAVMVEDIECPQPFPAIFIRCYPPYTMAGRKQDTSEDKYHYMEATDTLAAPFVGKVSTYAADGFQVKLGPTYEDTKATLDRLKNERFITKNTRAVFFDMAYYNPSVNLFCAVKFLFEMPAGGGVLPSAYFYSLRLSDRVNTWDFVTFGFQILFGVFLVFFVIADVRTLLFIKTDYFCSFWNYVNIAIIGSSIVFFIVEFLQNSEMKSVLRLMRTDINDYISFQTVTRYELIRRNIIAVVIFLVYLKIFKYMSFNWTMTILNRTMIRCLHDVFAFLLMFLVMFLGFALFGTLCFGLQIIEFSTLGFAMFTLIRTMLGDFPYDELGEADNFVTPYYYLLFVFLVFFVLLNMFLAIINDTYSDAKTELSVAAPERRVSDFWSTGIYNAFRECGCKACAPKGLVKTTHVNPAAEEIRAALMRCGYTPLDIELFLGRYNVDPEAQVRVKDVSTLIQYMRIEGSKRRSAKLKRNLGTNQPPIIALDDFAEQQKQLEKVEEAMKVVSEKIDSLLNRLLVFDQKQKARKEHKGEDHDQEEHKQEDHKQEDHKQDDHKQEDHKQEDHKEDDRKQ